MEQHEAERRQQEPKGGKTWEFVCDCQEDDCAKCASRMKIDAFEPTHAARRRAAPTRSKDESSAPTKAAVLKANKETKPPVTALSLAPKPAVLGERKRVPGH